MLRRIGAGAGGVLGIGFPAAAIGIGWFYSSVLLDTTQQPVFPERVLAVDGPTITLKRTRLAAQPGLWGLRWPEGLAVMGRIIETSRKTVVRERIGGDVPPVGTATVLDTGPYDPDPGARGLPFADVEVKTELGPCPAWHVPAGDTWVVMVHGRGGSRREALRVLPALHGMGLSALAITYRNDEGAPASPDGRYHLGDTEWVDVEAAVRYARANGAARIVLFAWSRAAP